MLPHFLFNLPRSKKKIILVLFDLLVLLLAFGVSSIYSFEWRGIPQYWQTTILTSFIPSFVIVAFLSILVFSACGFYTTMIRYVGTHQILKILLAALASTAFYIALYAGTKIMISDTQIADLQTNGLQINNLQINIGAAALYGGLVTLIIVVSRLLIAELYTFITNKSLARVLIYGAGKAGVQLLQALQSSDQYTVVALVDDDVTLHGINVNGLKVYKSTKLATLVKEENITQVLLAMPRLDREKRKDIIDKLQTVSVKVKTIPALADLGDENEKIDQLRDIGVEDLLGRDPVEPIQSMLESCIRDKVVLVTGAGGSIGSELSRQIAQLSPTHLLLLDSSEYALYQIEREIEKTVAQRKEKYKLTALLGSVLEKDRLKEIFTTFRVDTIYHAAAYKHVPMVEHNIIAGVRNNVFGTWHCAEAAIGSGVSTFVLVSTDKAVRPTNIMGASKRLAEQVLQGLAQEVDAPKYCMVRFGNVLDSSGSVVPLFREQIKAGGPITVTHPDIIRYFMTVPEAAQLVLQAGALAHKGEVFVLDMGEPVKIAELAEKMINLMGLTLKTEKFPLGDIEIKYTGLRPGEKLYEELLVGDNPWGTEHPRIMCAEEFKLPWANVYSVLNELVKACDTSDCERVRELLLNSEAGYSSNEVISDWVWSEKSAKTANEKETAERENTENDNVVSVFPPEKEPNVVEPPPVLTT